MVFNVERLKIDVDIIFYSLVCNFITFDISDKVGEEYYDVYDGYIEKRRIDKYGKVIDVVFILEKLNKYKEIE